MKILITERQLKKIISETEGCPCRDGSISIDCCKKDNYDFEVSKDVSDSLNIINKSLDLGLDIKKRGDSSYETWENVSKQENVPVSYFKDVLPDEYETYVPEIISGLLRGVKFDTRLIDILKEIEDKSGVEIMITGGQDKYHTTGYHARGMAIDFVPLKGGMNNETDSKIESAILDIILSGKYGEEIGYINERLEKTAIATGPHYHLSLGSPVEYTKFGMVDQNGVVHKTPPTNSLYWATGKFPENLSKMIEDGIFEPFMENMTVKVFCEKLIDLEKKHPRYVNKIPIEILQYSYDGDINKTLEYCKRNESLLSEPEIEKSPLKKPELISNNIVKNIPTDDYLIDLLKKQDFQNMSKKELKKLIKKIKEDGREDLEPIIRYYFNHSYQIPFLGKTIEE